MQVLKTANRNWSGSRDKDLCRKTFLWNVAKIRKYLDEILSKAVILWVYMKTCYQKRKNALSPEYLAVKCNLSSVRSCFRRRLRGAQIWRWFYRAQLRLGDTIYQRRGDIAEVRRFIRTLENWQQDAFLSPRVRKNYWRNLEGDNIWPMRKSYHIFKWKKYGNGKAQALCPAHPDKEASLTRPQGNDGKTLLKCHAGCSSESVEAGSRIKDGRSI